MRHPDQIVLHPPREYVRKFTEEIDKARVITAESLAIAETKGTGRAVSAACDGQATGQAIGP